MPLYVNPPKLFLVNMTIHFIWRINFLSRLVTGYQPVFVRTATTVLSDNPTVALPLLTINGWILMQRKDSGGSVSFNRNWIDYRDGFGSATGNDNYWLGLEKVYRVQQFGNVRLRVEVNLQLVNTLSSGNSLR